MPLGSVNRRFPTGKTARVTVRWAMKEADPSTKLVLDALKNLLENSASGINDLVREVIRSTLMAAYTDRFVRNSQIMKYLVRGNKELNARKRAYYLLRLQEAENRLSKAQPESDEFYRAKGAVTRYNAAYTGTKKPREDRRGRRVYQEGEALTETPNSLIDALRSSGAFGDRMAQVLDRFKDEHGMRKDKRADTLTISFGNVSLMNSVQTSPKSTSPMNVMWRQLEFGSGRYAKPAGNSVTIPRLPGTWIPKEQRYSKEYWDVDPQTGKRRRVPLTDGSWMLGGMRILGSHPGNWLRRETGAAYQEDALLFELQFATRLGQALRARG